MGPHRRDHPKVTLRREPVPMEEAATAGKALGTARQTVRSNSAPTNLPQQT